MQVGVDVAMGDVHVVFVAAGTWLGIGMAAGNWHQHSVHGHLCRCTLTQLCRVMLVGIDVTVGDVYMAFVIVGRHMAGHQCGSYQQEHTNITGHVTSRGWA